MVAVETIVHGRLYLNGDCRSRDCIRCEVAVELCIWVKEVLRKGWNRIRFFRLKKVEKENWRYLSCRWKT